jgi:large subunit ribosomal protein L15
MKLHELSKIKIKKQKRIGRGIGSGKGGHTVGRGAKGQRSRGNVGLFFEGTKIKKSLLKRLPLLRGKGKFKPLSKKPLIVNLKYLNLFPAGSEITLKTLAEKGIISLRKNESVNVKILGEGKLQIPLTVKLSCSAGARKKIEEAGGKVEK